MAIPQLEQGYTKIANSILEALAKIKLNGSQQRIIYVIFRYTYGFCRKEHELSETFIAKATGIHKKQVQRELNALIDMKFVLIVKEASFNTSRILEFNKNYDSWQVAKKIPPNEIDTHTGSEIAPSPGNELATQEIKSLNKNIKKDMCIDFFENIWSLYPNKKGKSQISLSRKKELFKLGDELQRATNRYTEEVKGRDKKYILNGSTFFNGRYKDYLDENWQGGGSNNDWRNF